MGGIAQSMAETQLFKLRTSNEMYKLQAQACGISPERAEAILKEEQAITMSSFTRKWQDTFEAAKQRLIKEGLRDEG